MLKRKDGRYQEAITLNGKRKYFYGNTKAEVLRKIGEYKEKESRGPVFEDVADSWWEETETCIAYNTTKGYKPAYFRACDEFRGVPISHPATNCP